MFVFPLILCSLGLLVFLYNQIQSRIGKEQELIRKIFAEENPQLEPYLRKSLRYKDYYSTIPVVKEVRKTGGMTEEQIKKFIEDMWVRHNNRVKELQDSKDQLIVENKKKPRNKN